MRPSRLSLGFTLWSPLLPFYGNKLTPHITLNNTVRRSFLTRAPTTHSLPWGYPAQGSSTLPASLLPPGSFDCRRRGRETRLLLPFFFAGSGTSVQFVESVLPLLISNTYLILSPAQLGLAPTTTHLNADAQNLHRIYLITDSSH